MDKDTVVVYWAPATAEGRETRTNLMWGAPTKLLNVMPKNHPDMSQAPGAKYLSCSGAKQFFNNTFTFLHPKDCTVTFSGSPLDPTFDASWDGFIGKTSAMGESYTIDYDFGWLFFSEESVQVRVTPAYLHNTSDQKTGFIAAGSYDISKWFRAINLNYILWEGQDTLEITKDEPAFYFEFLTDKKIVLKQFEPTPEIVSMGRQCVDYKFFFPFVPLKSLYEKFIGTNRHKRLLKLIKENLLDN
jgi:hypothetical protein